VGCITRADILGRLILSIGSDGDSNPTKLSDPIRMRDVKGPIYLILTNHRVCIAYIMRPVHGQPRNRSSNLVLNMIGSQIDNHPWLWGENGELHFFLQLPRHHYGLSTSFVHARRDIAFCCQQPASFNRQAVHRFVVLMEDLVQKGVRATPGR
jgi:hypothetical protein